MINGKIDRNIGFDPAFLFTNSGRQSLIIQLFEIGKLFVDKEIVTFTVLGTCMYPCIRQGDVIYIQPKSVEEIQVGEVVVYRRNNRLFSHRAISEGSGEKGAYVITRPDTAKYGDDGPVFNADILGVVERIVRKGKTLEPIKKDYNLIEKLWLVFCLKCFSLKQLLLEKLIFFIVFLQQFGLYRLAAGVFFQNLKRDMVFTFSIPAHAKATDKFCRMVCEEELRGLISDSDGSPISKWTVTLKVNSKEAASLNFHVRPKGSKFYGWWLIGANIRIRHRGTVIEKALLGKANDLLKQTGALDIFAGVLRTSVLERMFLSGLGFKPIHDHIMRRKIG